MTAGPVTAGPRTSTLRITSRMRLAAQAIRDGHCHGLAIIKQTGMSMSAVYQMLARMEAAGWLTCEVEDVAVAKANRRSQRKIYTLTGTAADALGWHDL